MPISLQPRLPFRRPPPLPLEEVDGPWILIPSSSINDRLRHTISKSCYRQNFPPTSLEDSKLVWFPYRFNDPPFLSFVGHSIEIREVGSRVEREQPESAITIQIAAIFRISLKAQMVDCSFVSACFFFFQPHNRLDPLSTSVDVKTRLVLSRLRLSDRVRPRFRAWHFESWKLGNVTGTRFESIRNAVQQASSVRPRHAPPLFSARERKRETCVESI